jgi:tetratricopeptide (TPR) repeat protein
MRGAMRGAIEAARRRPGALLVGLALVVAAAIYAPTLGRGLVSYDDPWLYRDNFVVAHPSAGALHTIFFDLDPRSPARFALGAEYLPVRDLSVMLDVALWGDAYAGFHLTNLVLYLASIVLVFAMLAAFGIERTLAGLAVLVWALHPSHAESVAWLSERKGLLGTMFAAAAGLGYARFRAGRGAGWLAGAALATVCAVWSKAPAAFAIAGLGVLELALPACRRSVRRSALGLGVLAIVGAAAFLPVLLTAAQTGVVAAGHGDRLATVLGVHGFYVELAAMVRANAPAYPALGGVEIAVGAVALVAILGVALVPARGRWQPPRELRAAAGLWLLGWFPASHLALALQHVVADRYALWPTLGVALAVATGLVHIPVPRARVALAIVIGLAEVARSLDAQSSWASSTALWERAVASNPADGNAWSMYAEALASSGRPDLAEAAVAEGLARAPSPRLELRHALLLLSRGQRAEAMAALERAARGGEPRAMENLALVLLDAGRLEDALMWARRAAAAAPFIASAQRAHGKVALAAGRAEEALAAFVAARGLEPQNLGNRYNLALALIALHRGGEARPHLEVCLADPTLHDRAAAALSGLR